jgi:hypothetical protein
VAQFDSVSFSEVLFAVLPLSQCTGLLFDVGSLNLVPYLLQVVSQQSSLLAPLAVEAVLKVIDPAKDKNVDLKVCC